MGIIISKEWDKQMEERPSVIEIAGRVGLDNFLMVCNIVDEALKKGGVDLENKFTDIKKEFLILDDEFKEFLIFRKNSI